MARWCVQKTGCCTAKVWAVVLGILGIIFILVATLIPPTVEKLIDSGLCDSICIPTTNDPEYVYNNWVSNDNRTMWPPEYLTFWVYNITNTFEIEANGSTPILNLVGPFVYLVHRYKFNIEYSTDDPPSTAMYETQERYEFLPENSSWSEDEMVYSINLPMLGSVQTLYDRLDVPYSTANWCGDNNYTDGGPNQTCLWSYRTVHETLFSQYCWTCDVSNQYYFGRDFLDLEFRLWNNQSTPRDSHIKKTEKTNYGLAGNCTVFESPIGPYCFDPATTGGDIRHQQKTGRGSLDDVSQLVLFYGNSTFNVWNTSIRGGTEKLSGTDQYQRKPFLSQSDTLTIFDELLFRHVDLTFQYEYERLGVTVWRYAVTDDLFSGADPFYFGDDTPKGFLSVAPTSVIVHGADAPVYSSRHYQVGADSTVTSKYICTNCPKIDKSAIDYGPVVDVEPTTGKTVGGYKRGQFNARIGQDYLFKDVTPANDLYVKVPDMIMPIFLFEDSSMFEQDQADQIKDGLDQINFGHSVQEGAKIGGGVAAGICLLAAILLGYHWYKIQQESQETWGDDVGEYTSAPSGVDGAEERGIND